MRIKAAVSIKTTRRALFMFDFWAAPNTIKFYTFRCETARTVHNMLRLVSMKIKKTFLLMSRAIFGATAPFRKCKKASRLEQCVKHAA